MRCTSSTFQRQPSPFSGLLASVFIGVVIMIPGCSKAPKNGDCAKLLEHRISIEVEQGSGTALQKNEHKRLLKESVGKDFLERCNRDLKAKQVRCGLKAVTPEDLDACDTP